MINNISVFKEIVQLTVQLTIIRVLYMAVGFMGMLFIAQLGKQELAAGALVSAFSTTIMVIAVSPLLAISIIASKYYGEGKLIEIGIILQQAWIISIIMGIIGSVFFWILPNLLVQLHQPSELIPLIQVYFHGIAWGTIPAFLIASCYQIFFPIKKGNLVIIWSILNLIFVTILGFFLIYGRVGLPKLGIAGWAYATSIVNWIVAIFSFLYLYFCKDFKSFQIFNFKNKIDFSQLNIFFKISLPITIQFSGELIAFSILNIMVGWLGTDFLSIQQILIQCSTLALMIPMGSAQACAILIGQALGKNQLHKVKSICYISIAFVFICMIIVAIIYLMMPMSLISLYFSPTQLNNIALVSLAKVMLRVIALSQIADAARNIFIGALRGLQDVWQPMWINLALLWLFAIPCAYLFGFPFKQGLFGINLAFLVAFAVGGILMLRQFSLKTKIHLGIHEKSI